MENVNNDLSSSENVENAKIMEEILWEKEREAALDVLKEFEDAWEAPSMKKQCQGNNKHSQQR